MRLQIRGPVVVLGLTLQACVTSSGATQQAPTHSDLVSALQTLDNEFCRKTIDICDYDLAKSDYDVVAERCKSRTTNTLKCLIADKEDGDIVRRCWITFRRYAPNEPWKIARGRSRGPMRLLTNCRDSLGTLGG